ncbi:MAG: hypothetical protein AAGD32_08165 [Planctomycetota bacterium]
MINLLFLAISLCTPSDVVISFETSGPRPLIHVLILNYAHPNKDDTVCVFGDVRRSPHPSSKLLRQHQNKPPIEGRSVHGLTTIAFYYCSEDVEFLNAIDLRATGELTGVHNISAGNIAYLRLPAFPDQEPMGRGTTQMIRANPDGSIKVTQVWCLSLAKEKILGYARSLVGV